MTSKKRPEARVTLGSQNLRTLALAVLALACLCALVTTASMVSDDRDAIQGSGTVIAEDRPVSHFERVSLRDQGTLIITQGHGETLTVETDDNLMRYIESRIRGGTLVLGLSDGATGRGVKPSKGITYRLSVGRLVGLEIADSCRIQADTLYMEQLEIRVHDSGNVAVDSLIGHTLQVYIEDHGDVHLAGRVGRIEVTVQDSGRYLARQLQSRTVVVAASDSAEVTLWAIEAIYVNATDSAHVQYYGDPRCRQCLADDGTLVGLGAP